VRVCACSSLHAGMDFHGTLALKVNMCSLTLCDPFLVKRSDSLLIMMRRKTVRCSVEESSHPCFSRSLLLQESGKRRRKISFHNQKDGCRCYLCAKREESELHLVIHRSVNQTQRSVWEEEANEPVFSRLLLPNFHSQSLH
jgi:hypothetical protein